MNLGKTLENLGQGLVVLIHRMLVPSAQIKYHPRWHLGSWRSDVNPLLRIVRRSAWKLVRRPCVIPWLEGIRVYVYPRDETSASLFSTSIFEPNEMLWLRDTLKPGQVFIDGWIL